MNKGSESPRPTEYSEKQAYLEIFRREAAIYEATPAWNIWERSKLRKKVRYAYGDAIGSGNAVNMPVTAWAAHRHNTGRVISDGWGRPFHRGWLFVLTSVSAVIAAVAVFLYLVIVIGIFDGSPPKPLPPGIQQRGYQFIIPSNYATRANYKEIHADDLCSRLPQWDGSDRGDEAIAHSSRDGGIIITCKLDD